MNESMQNSETHKQDTDGFIRETAEKCRTLTIPPIWCDGPTLIIEYPTGIRYTGQVGGLACLHPVVEGFLLPVTVEMVESLIGLSCPTACQGGRLTDELCRTLQASWPKIQGQVGQTMWEDWVIAFDHSRADEGTECWFPIRLAAHQQTHLNGRQGWLLMPDNCD